MALPLYRILKTDTPTQIRNKIYFAGEMQLEGTMFSYEIFLLPIVHSDSSKINSIQQYLINKLGTRQKDGKSCLDITEDIVRQNILDDNYSAMGFIKNISDPNWSDEASGSLQYYDWCKKRKGPQVWVNDLCRITEANSATSTVKPKVSPIKVLFKLFEQIAVKCIGPKLKFLHLLVEDKEPERSTLPAIYNKYGFHIVSSHECSQADSIVMKKAISESALNSVSSTLMKQIIPSITMTSMHSSPVLGLNSHSRVHHTSTSPSPSPSLSKKPSTPETLAMLQIPATTLQMSPSPTALPSNLLESRLSNGKQHNSPNIHLTLPPLTRSVSDNGIKYKGGRKNKKSNKKRNSRKSNKKRNSRKSNKKK